MKSLADALYSISITLWIGGLWAIGYIVAPTLFWTLADRSLAGSLAGKMFTLIAYVGIGCAAYVLLYRLVRFGGACFKHAIFWLVLAMLLLTLAGEFGVQPVLAGLKSQALPTDVIESAFRDRFAAWHGVASVIYLIESALGVLLVWRQGRDPN